MLTVTPIEAFNDNYIWCLHKVGSTEAFVVDPGDAAVVLQALEQQGLQLAGVLITHHHFDHTGGLEGLLEHRQVPVYGPQNPAINQVSERLSAGDCITVLGRKFEVIEVPGHTLDHIAFFGAGDNPLLFSGDTLFAGGCGRLFEGDARTMYQSLGRLASLPAATLVYCAHEYTLANLAFAAAVEPGNSELQARIARDSASREEARPTVPSRLELELATNPFLRSDQNELATHMQERAGVDPKNSVAVFTAVRAWKDNF